MIFTPNRCKQLLHLKPPTFTPKGFYTRIPLHQPSFTTKAFLHLAFTLNDRYFHTRCRLHRQPYTSLFLHYTKHQKASTPNSFLIHQKLKYEFCSFYHVFESDMQKVRIGSRIDLEIRTSPQLRASATFKNSMSPMFCTSDTHQIRIRRKQYC